MPLGNFSFGIVLRLKVTMGFNFVPSAIQPKATVSFAFSCPVVFTNTMRDDFVQAHAHATAQRAFDIPAALRNFIYHYRTVL